VFSWLLNLLSSKNKTAGRLVIFLALAAFLFAPKIVFGQIIIIEIMYDLSGTDDKHEWVELYNNGDSPVDLTGYKFNDGDTATNHALNVPPENDSRGSMILNAGDYALLAGNAATLAADLPAYDGTIIDTVLSLSNTGTTLKLLDKDGLEISTVSYNKDLGAAGNGRTLEWDGAALKESALDGGTPGQINSILNPAGATPSAAPRGEPYGTAPLTSPAATTTATPLPGAIAQAFDYSKDILINEFLPAPSDGEKEWLELFNAGSAVVNLTGWQIDDADNSTSPQIIPENTTIYANGFLVISFNKSALNNDGDKVRLLWPDDQVVHAVSYDKAKQGQSVAKIGTSWLWTNQPTPGQANKKSATGNNGPAALIATVEKIDPIEETAVAPTEQKINQRLSTSPTETSPMPTSPLANQSVGQPENINLSAAIGETTKESSRKNSTLSLAGVILLASLAAGALIYFRRQKMVDSQNFDD
jgi:hypothetical protein